MSLRIRLTLVSSLLILIGMLLGLGFQVLQARQRVSNELQAAMDMAGQLVAAILPVPSATTGNGMARRQLENLQRIEAMRHLQITLLDGDAVYHAVGLPADYAPAPAWFQKLVQVPVVERQRLLDAEGRQRLVLRSNPDAEIAEAWKEGQNFLLLLLLILVGLNGMLYITVGRWLAPVPRIVDSLARAEHGDFSLDVPEASLPELRTITAKLNQLMSVLRGQQAENQRLSRLSLHIQEEERRHLARELHDEMGQALTAIKAIAWSLRQRHEAEEWPLREGVERIGEIAASMSAQVRNMLGRLRPAVLDELGLLPALQQQVQDWNATHRDCHCRLAADEAFAALPVWQHIHVYRIVQEALTNVARHAGASTVLLRLTVGADFLIEVADDGRGFDVRLTPAGMGLRGISERCQALGGHSTLDTAPGQGVRLAIRIPGLSVSKQGVPP